MLEIEDQLTFRANRIFTMFHVPNKYGVLCSEKVQDLIVKAVQ